jgi:hypothetical protein
MRTLADLAALTAGLIADLFRKDGPIRRSPARLSAGQRPGPSADGGPAGQGGVLALAALLVGAVGAGSQALVRGLRARLGGGSGGASAPRQIADLVTRGTSSLARSVVAVPGGPLPVVAAAGVVLTVALYAWTQPTDTDRVQMRPFVVEYAFDYRAQLPPNMVYEARDLRFGDPIFLNVVDAVDVVVDWSVPRGDVVVSGGRLAVTTVLRSEAGWSRVLDRVPEVEVDGLRARSGVRIDLPAAIALARSVDEATGVSRPVRLEVLVETLLDDAVTQSGGAGVPIDGYSAASIAFVLDERVVRLADVPVAQRRADDPLAGILARTGAASTETGDASSETGRSSSETGGASTETGSTSRFAQDVPGSVSEGGRVGVREVVQMFATDVLEPNHLRLGPLRLEVATARRNLTLLGIALLVAGLLGLQVLRRLEELGEAAVIEARYGSVITPLPGGVNGHGAQAVDVGSFEALHTLALDRDTPVMADRRFRTGQVAYYLFDGPNTFRYVARVGSDGTPSAAEATDALAALIAEVDALTGRSAEPSDDAIATT